MLRIKCLTPDADGLYLRRAVNGVISPCIRCMSAVNNAVWSGVLTPVGSDMQMSVTVFPIVQAKGGEEYF